uniref:(northern house mosquito) hypothetical protein n=1 Tax=Culex pipiens TaxID=7175 RepID=A0A8D8CTJ8_CULPI
MVRSERDRTVRLRQEHSAQNGHPDDAGSAARGRLNPRRHAGKLPAKGHRLCHHNRQRDGKKSQRKPHGMAQGVHLGRPARDDSGRGQNDRHAVPAGRGRVFQQCGGGCCFGGWRHGAASAERIKLASGQRRQQRRFNGVQMWTLLGRAGCAGGNGTSCLFYFLFCLRLGLTVCNCVLKNALLSHLYLYNLYVENIVKL